MSRIGQRDDDEGAGGGMRGAAQLAQRLRG